MQKEAVTKQWDSHFDALLEWLLRPVHRDALNPSEWRLMDWAARGSQRERRLAAWAAEQRHLARADRLSESVLARLQVCYRAPQPPLVGQPCVVSRENSMRK